MILRLLRVRRARLGPVLGQAVLEALHLLTQPLRLFGERRRRAGSVCLPVGTVRCRRVGERPLLRRQFLRLVAERLHRPFMRRALQHLRAALELLLHALLHLRQVAQRIARLLAVQLLRRVLELQHLRLHLWRERLAQQRLRFAELPRQRRVERSRRLELLLEILRRVAELLHALRHGALLLREGSRLLRALERHVPLRLRRRRGRGAPRLLAVLARALPGLRACRLVRALRQRALRARGGARFLHRRITQGARAGAELLGRGATHHQLAAHAALCPRRCIDGLGADPHHLARL